VPESNIVLNNVTDELVYDSSLVRQNIHEYVPLILEPVIEHVSSDTMHPIVDEHADQHKT